MEEKGGKMMERTNETSKNIIITVLIIMIIGLAGLMCYDKFIVNKESEKPTSTTEKKEETKKEENTNTNATTPTNVTYTTKKIDLRTVKKETVSIDAQDITIALEEIPSTDVKKSNFVINGKNILVSESGNSVNEIYVMGDIVIVPVYSTDVRGTELYIFDKNGNILKKVYEFDKNTKGMAIAVAMANTFTFDNNKILIKASRYTHGPSVIYGDKTVEFCNNDNGLKENGISDDLIVEATYEIDYLSNNKLSDIKMVDGTSKTLKQAKKETCK